MGLFKTAVRASVATRVVGSTHRRQQQRCDIDAFEHGPVDFTGEELHLPNAPEQCVHSKP